MKIPEHAKDCLSHELFINWNLLTHMGQPALCCNQCVTPKGKRKNKPLFIRYIKTNQIQPLLDMGVEERTYEV